jgi:hypothetical protein
LYPLDRRLWEPQSRSGHGGEEKNSQPLPGLEPPNVQPVAQRYTTELSRILFYVAFLVVYLRFRVKNFPPIIGNYPFVLALRRSRDSSFGIALDKGLDDQGSRFRFPAGAGNFSLHHRFQNGSGSHPASYPMGTRGSFLGVKRPELSPPSSAEVKE